MLSFWSYWYFHAPNFILAALVYTLMGRFVLGFFVPENWDNYIWRAFQRLTNPIVAVVTAGSPAIVPHRVILLFASLWLTVARVALGLGLAAAGLLPAGGTS